MSKLAEVLDIPVESLLNCTSKTENSSDSFNDIIQIILKCIPLAMGVALIVSSIMGKLTLNSGFSMCGIALFCLSLKNLMND